MMAILISLSFFLVLRKIIKQKYLFTLLLASSLIGFITANLDVIKHIKMPFFELETYRAEIKKDVTTVKQTKDDVLQIKKEIIDLQNNIQISAKLIAENQFYWIRSAHILPIRKGVKEKILKNLDEFAKIAFPDEKQRTQWIKKMNMDLEKILEKK